MIIYNYYFGEKTGKNNAQEFHVPRDCYIIDVSDDERVVYICGNRIEMHAKKIDNVWVFHREGAPAIIDGISVHSQLAFYEYGYSKFIEDLCLVDDVEKLVLRLKLSDSTYYKRYQTDDVGPYLYATSLMV